MFESFIANKNHIKFYFFYFIQIFYLIEAMFFILKKQNFFNLNFFNILAYLFPEDPNPIIKKLYKCINLI